MFGNFRVADLIAIMCLEADVDCRAELRKRKIVKEADYVTTFSTRVRDRLGSMLPCHGQTLKPTSEQKHGADGVILFQHESEIKVGWYEAKWPRFTQNNYKWDEVYKGHTVTHFTEQIFKQRKWKDTVALWEMFFNEADDGHDSPPLEYFGSSCVTHDNAYDFLRNNGIVHRAWTMADLKKLLAINGTNIYSIVYDIISCRQGKKLVIDRFKNDARIVNSKNDNDFIEIPLPEIVPQIGQGNERDARISAFMERRNLSSYLFFDITNTETLSF